MANSPLKPTAITKPRFLAPEMVLFHLVTSLSARSARFACLSDLEPLRDDRYPVWTGGSAFLFERRGVSLIGHSPATSVFHTATVAGCICLRALTRCETECW